MIPLIDQREIVQYLINRQLIPESAVVNGCVEVNEVSRRNINFKVVSQGGQSYFVKQGVGTAGQMTAIQEAAAYRLLIREREQSALTFIPEYYGYDASDGVLILELFAQAQDVRQYHAAHRHFSIRLARAMGRALASLHGLQLDTTNARYSTAPWVLSLHHPRLSDLEEISSANLELIQIVQGHIEFQDTFDYLRETTVLHSFIHGDAKWDNWLVLPPDSPRSVPSLRLVDWELSGFGDPGWDVGTALSDPLCAWVRSVPMASDIPPADLLHWSRSPSRKVHPITSNLWQAYCKSSDLMSWEISDRLARCSAFAAVRVLQTAFEEMQQSTKLSSHVICLLQMSLNIVRYPREAMTELFGIPISIGA